MNINLIPLATITVEKGLQTGPFGSQLKAHEYTEYGIPVVMPKDIKDGKITIQTIAYTSNEKSKKLKKHLIKSGDIIFPRRGNLGRIAIAENSNEGWICGSGCLRARLKKDVLSRYIHQYVQLEWVAKWLESHALGQTMLNLNTEIIGALPLYLPSYEKQKEIAKILQTWDEAIEKTEVLVETKECYYKWLLHEFIGKRKACRKLGEVCGLEKGVKTGVKTNKERGNIPYLEIGDINIRSKSYDIRNKLKKPVDSAVKVPKNTLLISTVRPTRGAVTKTESEVYVSSAFCKIHLENDFYFYCVQQDKFFHHLKVKQSGATYPTVKESDILSFEVPFLSVNQQQIIANKFNIVQKEIKLLKELAEQYRTQKRGLMQKLLTGKWHIKTKETA